MKSSCLELKASEIRIRLNHKSGYFEAQQEFQQANNLILFS